MIQMNSDTLKSKCAYVLSSVNRKRLKKHGFVFLIILAAAIFCELFVFNFKWVGSAFDKPLEIKPEFISGFSQNGGGSYRTISSNSAVIQFKDINEELKYLRFSPGKGFAGRTAEIVISATDEANELPLSAPARIVAADAERSQYIRLHFSGKVKNLKIEIKNADGCALQNGCAVLNARVPLVFSWTRVIIFALILMLLYILRPSSGVYKYRTNMKSPVQRLCAAALIVVCSLVMWSIINLNTDTIEYHNISNWHDQYYLLVDSFKSGHLSLDIPVSDKLKNMENPYDQKNRDKIMSRSEYKWDAAYRNGKYYCYFGAAPAVLLYLPYNLISGGKDLPNYIAAFIFGVMVIIGIFLLLWEVIKKWYEGTPFVLYLLLSAVFSAIVLSYPVYKADFYIVPITSAMMFAVFGIALWLSAERETDGESALIPWRLTVGSACVALTALCRPQFLISVIFGVVLFWKYVFGSRTLFSKKSVKQTVAVCLPFVIVGAITMLYNAGRFGSPFDFGANYNLTSNDMTKRGLVFGRCGLGIFTYLFQPPKIDAVFPFLHDFTPIATTYQGLTLHEYMMGGVLFLFPILLIGVYGLFRKDLFTDKRTYAITLTAVAAAAVVAVLDAQMAGLLTRYYTDFSWLIALSSCITIFALYARHKGGAAGKSLIRVTLILSAASFALAFLSVFAHSDYTIRAANPTVYYNIQHLIAFWM